MVKILPVEEMMCASCAINVENALNEVDGVKKASVNYANAKATIEFDGQKIGLEDLEKAVEAAGYRLIVEEISAEELDNIKNKHYKDLKRDFYGSLFFSVPIFLISIFHVHFAYSDYVQGILSAICLFIFGGRFFRGAYKHALRLSANMDTLVSMSTGVAFLYSWSILLFRDFWVSRGVELHLYFESSVMIISFILLGKVLENRAKIKTSGAIKKLMGLQTKEALVRDGEEWVKKNLEDVKIGDMVLVRAGEKISVDGEITKGESYVDESMITGEPIAKAKSVRDRVFAGTINDKGVLEVRVEKLFKDTLLSNIIKAVENAQGTKPPVQLLVDKIAGIFVPVVIGIAVVTFLVWNIFGGDNGFSHGLQSFVTVLVIACPCALGLATPTAIMVGVGKGAENGVLIKDAQSLEVATKVNCMVLDKTGTITEGRPVVIDYFFKNEEDTAVVKTMEVYSGHPISGAIVKRWEVEKNVEIEDFKEIAGAGIEARYKGEIYRIGSKEWMVGKSLDEDIRLKINELGVGNTLVMVSKGDDVVGVVAVGDRVKGSSEQAVKKFKEKGIEVWMLTGDNEESARNISQRVGIEKYVFEVKPSDKQEFIKEIQKEGKVVAMVGDGINDSQALAQADLSIAMGSGSDIAMDVAQVTVIGDDLGKVSKAIRLSEMTMNVLKKNLFWAFIYNVIGIPIAAGVLYPKYGFLLNPMIAGMAMAFSSVSVVTNSLVSFRKRL